MAKVPQGIFRKIGLFMLSGKIMKILIIILLTGFVALAGCIDSSSYKEVTLSQLVLTTDKEIYHSNETLKAHIEFNATQEGKA